MDPNNNLKPLQARETGFDRNEYALAAEGVFTGTLVMKIYGDFCLRCYFQTADGCKLKLTAWQNRRTGRYVPRGNVVDFKDVPLQTRWENNVGQSRTNKLTWTDAKKIGGVR